MAKKQIVNYENKVPLCFEVTFEVELHCNFFLDNHFKGVGVHLEHSHFRRNPPRTAPGPLKPAECDNPFKVTSPD